MICDFRLIGHRTITLPRGPIALMAKRIAGLAENRFEGPRRNQSNERYQFDRLKVKIIDETKRTQ